MHIEGKCHQKLPKNKLDTLGKVSFYKSSKFIDFFSVQIGTFAQDYKYAVQTTQELLHIGPLSKPILGLTKNLIWTYIHTIYLSINISSVDDRRKFFCRVYFSTASKQSKENIWTIWQPKKTRIISCLIVFKHG